MSEFLKGFKTVIFNGALSLFGCLEVTNLVDAVQQDNSAGWISLAAGIANCVLRKVTDSAIFSDS